MERIRYLAELSVRRAVGFVGLGVGVTMLSLSYDAVLALKTASALLAITTVVLTWRAWLAPTRDIRDTEVWILMDQSRRPADPALQQLVGGILRETYLRYARMTMFAVLAFWGLSLLLTLAPLR